MVGVLDEFNTQERGSGLEEAVFQAMERIRLRMMSYTLTPTQTALRLAAREEFDNITPELADALRDALMRWRHTIPHLYDVERFLFFEEDPLADISSDSEPQTAAAAGNNLEF